MAATLQRPLGSHSPHQGRLYIALTDDNFVAATGAYTTSTFIELYTSDNGGASWNYSRIVNDDNGLTDGFSAGGYYQPNSAIGATNPAGGAKASHIKVACTFARLPLEATAIGTRPCHARAIEQVSGIASSRCRFWP